MLDLSTGPYIHISNSFNIRSGSRLSLFGNHILRSHVPKTPILYWDGRQKKIAACKEQHLGDGASTRTQTPAAFVTTIDSATYWDCILEVEDLENLPSPSKSTARKPILDLFASQKNFEFQFEYS